MTTTVMAVRTVWDTREQPRDYYCPKCSTFLFASSSTDGKNRIYCRRCKQWQVLSMRPPEMVRSA